MNFQIYDKSFGHKIPKILDERQNGDSFSRFKKDNSPKHIPSKKSDKPLGIIAKNAAFDTENDYNFFSPQRIKSGLNGGLFWKSNNRYKNKSWKHLKYILLLLNFFY